MVVVLLGELVALEGVHRATLYLLAELHDLERQLLVELEVGHWYLVAHAVAQLLGEAL